MTPGNPLGVPCAATSSEEFIEEGAAFPKGAYDDQVDAVTQALLLLGKRGSLARVRSGKLESNWTNDG